MTSNEMLLPGLRAWFDDQVEPLAARGTQLSMDTSRADWDKASLVLEADNGDFLGQLALWDSGEAELECAEITTGNVRKERRDLRSPADLHDALSVLMGWLNGGGPDSGR